MESKEKEIWKDIKGYEGLYIVSNHGNIISLNYNNRGFSKILSKTMRNKNGYLRVNLYLN